MLHQHRNDTVTGSSHFTCRDHARLILAKFTTSSRDLSPSQCRMLSVGLIQQLFRYKIIVRRRRRSSSIRKICPAKRSLRLITVVMRSKSGDDAVALKSSPVIMERKLLLKPFTVLVTHSVSRHVTQP